MLACMKTVIVGQVNIQLEAADSSGGNELSQLEPKLVRTRVCAKCIMLRIFVGQILHPRRLFTSQEAGFCPCPQTSLSQARPPHQLAKLHAQNYKILRTLIPIALMAHLLPGLFGKTNQWFVFTKETWTSKGVSNSALGAKRSVCCFVPARPPHKATGG